MHATRLFAAILLLIGSAAPSFAGWQDSITSYDRQRLAALDQARTLGLSAVDAGASPIDRNAAHGVLDAVAGPILAQQLSRNWRWRLMKLGGLEPAIVYTWHACRFTSTPKGLFFEKLSGTQRFSGYADADGARMILLAATSVRDEKQRSYSGGSEGFGARATPNDHVGAISSIGAGRARIEFPYPVIESLFDVIELQR
jgi:hypothetical protein